MNTCLDLRGKYGKMSGERDRESRQPHVMLEASTGGLTTYVTGGREMATHILPQNDSDSQDYSTVAPSEKHIEDWIFANQQDFFSQVPTLWARRIVGRQVELASGRPDLIVAAKLGLRVIELKKNVIDGEAVAQVIRYTGEIGDLFNWAGCHVESPDDPHYYDPTQINSFYPLVKGVLIGHSFTRKALLACATNDITAIKYECYDDGYLFEETCELIDTDYYPAMESDLGAAIKEVMRHRRLFIEDRESLKAIYQQEGSL